MTTKTLAELGLPIKPWPYGPDPEPNVEEGVLYTDCPPSAYHPHPALSSGKLRRMAKTPLHAVRCGSPKETAAMLRGSILDCLIISQDAFDSRYEYVGDYPLNGKGVTKEIVAAYRQREAEALRRGIRLVREQDIDWPMDALVAAANEVRASEEYACLIGSGAEVLTQVAYWWTDGKTGIKCRALADWIVTDGTTALVADLKTRQDASPDAVGRELWYDCGDVQLAHYGQGFHDIAGIWPDLGWLEVEVNDSMAIGAYALGPEDLEYSAALRRREILTERYAKTVGSGVLHGWTRGKVAKPILPERAYREIGEGTYGLAG